MLTDLKNLRVAVVHDWLVSQRGGERVLEALLELFPQAEVFTLFHKKGSVSPAIEKHVIHTSFLNRLPGVFRYYRHLLPFMPLAAEGLAVKGFDLVISSSTCVAKGVIPGPQSQHLCYCNTTMRYAWDQSDAYFSGWTQALAAPFLHYLRLWDVTSSARVDRFVANSHFVAKRIEKYYRRESDVTHPFVDLNRFHPVAGERGDYYLIVSALAPYKRVELAVEACEKLGRKLLVVGSGQRGKQLKQLGGKHTQWLGNLPDSEVADLYAGARALLFPGVEDFGITPLEAMASGTPVIAFSAGGALETIEAGKTGIFFHEPTADSLANAISHFEALPQDWSRACRERAALFSKERFQMEIRSILNQMLAKPVVEMEKPALQLYD